ncbi:hypothetical protein [Deinococcus humi]|uniref:Uncharacterized protein n=1 Tax=Deinococcus humi TaxID=662880 RepID=A0A7W8NG71_9DEIO|nr:hypothetical protein [Deinococcus humi]MBB5364515.1 hypothetical protein [Deinococcus humi]
MSTKQHQNDSASWWEEPGQLADLVDKRLQQVYALAKGAGVRRTSLQTVLMRLHTEGDQHWAPDSSEARVQRAIDELRLPPVAILVNSWVHYLELTDGELQALREGVREGVVLALLDLQVGPVREALLHQAKVEGWMVRDMRRAVLRAPNTAKSRQFLRECLLE